MKINRQIFHLPPFLSTKWKNIASIHSQKDSLLIVTLNNGAQVQIPLLDSKVTQAIFAIHEQVLEQEYSASTPLPQPPASPTAQQEVAATPSPPLPPFPSPLGVNIALPGLEGFSTFMQHSPENAHAADLPHELLVKIATLSKSMGLHEATNVLPAPEPHCNCPFCQIARAISDDSQQEACKEESATLEEEVSDEDLKFRDWDIQQTAEKLFLVKKVNEEEHYNVFLGDPIGCTCGKKNCEHIRVVLES